MSKLSIEQAYAVQDRVTQSRIAKGEKVAGYKVGCTSEAIRSQLNLSEPVSARLFDLYVYKEGANLNLNDYLNCAIEPEMVFLIGTDVRDEDLSDDGVLR